MDSDVADTITKRKIESQTAVCIIYVTRRKHEAKEERILLMECLEFITNINLCSFSLDVKGLCFREEIIAWDRE